MNADELIEFLRTHADAWWCAGNGGSPAMASTDADGFLIDQIRDGSQAAWRQLIDRYTGRLLAFARARTRSMSDAEDLVQEAFVGFLQSVQHFDRTRSLETYLFTILRYKLYDQLRQRKATIVSEPADEPDWWDRITPDDTATPSGHAAIAEAKAQQEALLADLLRELIYEYRDKDAFRDLQIIELVFYAGMRNLEVAELLDMDQKAVAGVKFRAIGKLQKFLATREPQALSCLDEDEAEVTVARVWRERRLTCLKRSTLGSFLLGVLEDPWQGYTQFHLDVVACPMCLANLKDLESEQEEAEAVDHERMFQSSVGFLKRSDT